MDERERAVAGLCALKAMVALEGHTADVDGRLLIVRDLGRARVEIGLDALEVLGQLLSARFQTVELAEQAASSSVVSLPGTTKTGMPVFALSSSASHEA